MQSYKDKLNSIQEVRYTGHHRSLHNRVHRSFIDQVTSLIPRASFFAVYIRTISAYREGRILKRMSFPSQVGLPLRAIPFRYLPNYFSAVQSLAIILDNSESVARKVLRRLDFGENQINYLYERFRRPVFEALALQHQKKGTVQDLYRALVSTNQINALRALYTHLLENLNDSHCGEINLPAEAPSDVDWENLLDSRQYRISSAINWPQLFVGAYISPIYNRVQEIVSTIFPFTTAYASDMYRSISKLMNNVAIFISLVTAAQNTMSICYGGNPNLVTIFISFSLWVKPYLMDRRLNQLRRILTEGNDEQRHRRADFLYKEIRIALLFVFFFKIALLALGCVLFYAFPHQMPIDDFQSKWTQFVLIFFMFEIFHNAFYLITFYRDPNIFGIINDLFPQ